jgi:hypothetical protein
MLPVLVKKLRKVVKDVCFGSVRYSIKFAPTQQEDLPYSVIFLARWLDLLYLICALYRYSTTGQGCGFGILCFGSDSGSGSTTLLPVVWICTVGGHLTYSCRAPPFLSPRR